MMKYLFLFLACGIIWACNANDKSRNSASAAQEHNDSLKLAAMSDTANFTTIKWMDSVEKHLATVKEGEVVEILWKFKNTGNKPLIIAEVRPGCGCTIAEKPLEPVAPGKEGLIKAKFDSRGHPNLQDKDIYIFANNSNKNNVNSDLLRFHIQVNPK